jgi:hypothetical protein
VTDEVCRELVISGRDTPVVNTGMRGLFGRNNLLAANSKSVSFVPCDLRLGYGGLNHVQTDAFDPQNRTTGISEITL